MSLINNHLCLPLPLPHKTKVKDQNRTEAARKGRENYMKILKERLLKDNQEAQMTLKEFIDYFQQDLNDPASTLMATEHNTQKNTILK